MSDSRREKDGEPRESERDDSPADDLTAGKRRAIEFFTRPQPSFRDWRAAREAEQREQRAQERRQRLASAREENAPERLMIDPSLLLSATGLGALSASIRDHPRWNMWIPESVYAAVMAQQSLEPIAREFELLGEAANPEEIQALVANAQSLHPYSPLEAGDAEGIARETVYPRLRELVPDNPFYADVLFEEWLFLTSQSWIASGVRRAFDVFKLAGAGAIELPREAFDAVVRRTPHVIPAGVPEPLRASQRLRAVSKWVAAAGPAWVPFLGPLAPFAGVGLGLFLLFDP